MPTTADKLAALEAELAAQRARVEELERKAKPPAPFDPGPYQRYDPTAGMSMPQSAIDAMVAAEPRGFMAGVVGDSRAPTSPSSAGASGAVTKVSTAPGIPGSGWRDAAPLSNPPGIAMVDAICEADAARDRAERMVQ